MALPKKKSPIQLVRSAIHNHHRTAFQDAIQNIRPGQFLIESWHECLKTVLDPNFGEDSSFYVNGLLCHGGDDNAEHRRLLLKDEVERIGRVENTPEDDRDEEVGQIATKIATRLLDLYPELAWTPGQDTGRTVLHTAADSGACSVISLVGDLLRRRQGTAGVPTIPTVVKRRDGNSQTALGIAIKSNKSTVVDELVELDPRQLDSSNAADIADAVEKDNLPIMKTLLSNSPSLVTATLIEKALNDKTYEMLEYLVDISPDMLLDTKANYLIKAVKAGQLRVVKFLVEKFPELTGYSEPPYKPGENLKYHYVLSFNDDKHGKAERGVRTLIRDEILPVIIERNRISFIRELLADTSELQREMCLDLSAFTSDSPDLKRFLDLARADLSDKRVKEVPPDNVMSVIASHILSRSANSGLNLDVEELINNLISTLGTLSINGQEPTANGHNIPASLSPTKTRNQALGALSNLLDQSRKNLQTEDTSLPSFNVEFEPTLKYVELPSFEDTSNVNREEAKDILDWLRLCKGVTRIFELRARDSLHFPHTEETIEKALAGFNIQEFDWQRLDLSIDTIRLIAPGVKQLHLYSSGNWASIDHWTGLRGITTLTDLENLQISVIEDRISPTRASECKDKLEERLEDIGWKKATVDIRPWQANRTTPGTDAIAEEMLTPVDVTKLHYFLSKYRELLNDPQYADEYGEPSHIKVAVIDSGVDRSIFIGDQRSVTGQSFVHNHDGSKESPWWLAGDHHGSHIAYVISQLDPGCELYIAKVTESKTRVRMDRVIQAIEWAIKNEVDIINLSLVLYSDDPKLLAAIGAAHHAGILVFCATADRGFTHQYVWPAKYSKDYDTIFPICSSTANGRITEYSSETVAQYTFQGEDIITNSQGTRVSGSSVATGMATGVASLVLACHRMLLEARGGIPDYGSSALPGLPDCGSRAAVIKRAFTRMCGGEQAKEKPPLVVPSLLFPEKHSDYMIREPDDLRGWLFERLQQVLSGS